MKERMKDIRQRGGIVKIFVKRKGFSAEEDWWAPFSSFGEDASALIRERLAELKISGTTSH